MTEKAFKILMIANIIIESVFYICVTIAAIYFREAVNSGLVFVSNYELL